MQFSSEQTAMCHAGAHRLWRGLVGARSRVPFAGTGRLLAKRFACRKPTVKVTLLKVGKKYRILFQ